MKYICKRCGLESDETKGTDCKGIKGKIHQWIEMSEFKEKQRKSREYREEQEKKFNEFMATPNGSNWLQEYEDFKAAMLVVAERLQKKYIKAYEMGKFNNFEGRKITRMSIIILLLSFLFFISKIFYMEYYLFLLYILLVLFLNILSILLKNYLRM